MEKIGDNMDERMLRILSNDELDRIKHLNILIVGLGGVGGAAFESLVRCGVSNITVIDNDVFDNSNLNRQLLSNINNIGHNKALEANLRAININPDILVDYKEMFLDESNIEQINITKFDYVLDCCDSINTKVLLAKVCGDNNIKFISSMGTGNRLDPSKLIITDIWKTNNDPLAKKMRSILRKEKIYYKFKVVTSTELPRKSKEGVGSLAFVPNCAGFFMASFVINDII